MTHGSGSNLMCKIEIIFHTTKFCAPTLRDFTLKTNNRKQQSYQMENLVPVFTHDPVLTPPSAPFDKPSCTFGTIFPNVTFLLYIIGVHVRWQVWQANTLGTTTLGTRAEVRGWDNLRRRFWGGGVCRCQTCLNIRLSTQPQSEVPAGNEAHPKPPPATKKQRQSQVCSGIARAARGQSTAPDEHSTLVAKWRKWSKWQKRTPRSKRADKKKPIPSDMGSAEQSLRQAVSSCVRKVRGGAKACR